MYGGPAQEREGTFMRMDAYYEGNGSRRKGGERGTRLLFCRGQSPLPPPPPYSAQSVLCIIYSGAVLLPPPPASLRLSFQEWEAPPAPAPAHPPSSASYMFLNERWWGTDKLDGMGEEEEKEAFPLSLSSSLCVSAFWAQGRKRKEEEEEGDGGRGKWENERVRFCA